MNRKIDKKTTKQVVVDIWYHKQLKLRAVEDGDTVKGVLEGILSEEFPVDKGGKYEE
jgi:hypothetical protein